MPSKGKSREGGEVRERLLVAALDLFNRKGYASTSVREIVDAAGVTKPVLYYYFRSKEGIYLELLTSPFKQLELILQETLSVKGGARERIERLVEKVFCLFMEYLSVGRLMYSIYYGPPQGAPFFDFEGYHLKLGQETAKLVQEGIQQGEFNFKDPQAAAWLIVGALNFVMEEQLCQREPQIDLKGLRRMLSIIFGNSTSLSNKRKR